MNFWGVGFLPWSHQWRGSGKLQGFIGSGGWQVCLWRQTQEAPGAGCGCAVNGAAASQLTARLCSPPCCFCPCTATKPPESHCSALMITLIQYCFYHKAVNSVFSTPPTKLLWGLFVCFQIIPVFVSSEKERWKNLILSLVPMIRFPNWAIFSWRHKRLSFRNDALTGNKSTWSTNYVFL